MARAAPDGGKSAYNLAVATCALGAARLALAPTCNNALVHRATISGRLGTCLSARQLDDDDDDDGVIEGGAVVQTERHTEYVHGERAGLAARTTTTAAAGAAAAASWLEEPGAPGKVRRW